MKIFVKIQGILAMAGIVPNQSNRFNWKIALEFLLFAFILLSSVVVIFTIENNNLTGYVIGLCTTSALIEMGVSFAAIVLQQTKLFEFIEITEELIHQSNPPQFD